MIKFDCNLVKIISLLADFSIFEMYFRIMLFSFSSAQWTCDVAIGQLATRSIKSTENCNIHLL